LGKFGAQGQGPVPNHWKRSDSSGAAEATAALAYLVWTASIKDEPLFDEGVYAGLNQLFLSDAGRDARSDLQLESHLPAPFISYVCVTSRESDISELTAS
jgi:hypothetical protein